LYLGKNLIEYVGFNAFPKTIEVLSLNMNKIHSIENNALINTKNLKVLSMLGLNESFSKNSLDKILKYSLNLQELKVSGANRGNITKDSVFTRMKNLKVLALNKMGISSFPRQFFWNMRYLKELSLAGNNLSKFPYFFGAGRLEKINLSNNKITKQSQSDLFYQNDLKVLDLSSNLISKIDKMSFYWFEKLEEINYKNNKLVNIDSEVFHRSNYPNRQIMTIDVSDNPLQCDCEFFHKFYKYFITQNYTRLKCENDSNCLECNSPESLRGSWIGYMSKSMFNKRFGADTESCTNQKSIIPTENDKGKNPSSNTTNFFDLVIVLISVLFILFFLLVILCRKLKILKSKQSRVRLTSFVSSRDDSIASYSVNNSMPHLSVQGKNLNNVNGKKVVSIKNNGKDPYQLYTPADDVIINSKNCGKPLMCKNFMHNTTRKLKPVNSSSNNIPIPRKKLNSLNSSNNSVLKIAKKFSSLHASNDFAPKQPKTIKKFNSVSSSNDFALQTSQACSDVKRSQSENFNELATVESCDDFNRHYVTMHSIASQSSSSCASNSVNCDVIKPNMERKLVFEASESCEDAYLAPIGHISADYEDLNWNKRIHSGTYCEIDFEKK